MNMLIPSWLVFRTDPTEEAEDDEDEEETDNHVNKHNKDDNDLQPLTNNDLAIVGECARRLLDGA